MQKKKSREETLLIRDLFTVRWGFGEASETFSGKKPNRNDTDLVQHHERDRHHQLVDNIRRGREDGGNNEIYENGIFPVTVEESYINQPCFGKKDHEDRHFKNHTKSQKQSDGQVEIFAHRRQGGEKIVVVTYEKFKSGWEDDKISESRPTDKAAGGQQGKRNQYPFLMTIEPGGNKAPDLRKNYRGCKQYATNQGKL